MKTRILVFASVLFLVASSYAQEMNKKFHDPKLDREVLVGYCDVDGLEQGEFGESFTLQYKIYSPEPLLVKQIKSIINKGDYEITTVFADWCSDSEYQVPNFYKLLDEVGFADNKRKLIAVDRSKDAHLDKFSEYDIQLVPTFIIYLQGEEIGRIIETPNETLEEDFLKILKSTE